MKTQKALASGAHISCVYLLIGLTLALIPYLLSSKESALHYNSTNGAGLMLLLAAFLYFVHFIYGVFYYPAKYKQIAKTFAYDDFDVATNVWDLSYLRAILSMFIIPIAFTRAGYTLGIYQIFYLVWILVNLFLLVKTKTNSLFVRDSLMIDAPLLMPWKKPDNSEHLYETIYFLRPVLEDENVWRQQVVKTYVRAENQYHSTRIRSEMSDLKLKQSATEKTVKLAAALKIPSHS
ncbi:MAG: hypothetical protein WC467_00445 [Patescibacteria group bacterium]